MDVAGGRTSRALCEGRPRCTLRGCLHSRPRRVQREQGNIRLHRTRESLHAAHGRSSWPPVVCSSFSSSLSSSDTGAITVDVSDSALRHNGRACCSGRGCICWDICATAGWAIPHVVGIKLIGGMAVVVQGRGEAATWFSITD